MPQLEIQVEKREITGKRLASLRRSGITPLHLFGAGIDSLALQVQTPGFEKQLAQAGTTRLLSLKIKGERTPRPALVRDIQRDPLTGRLLHVDFFQVKMGENVAVDVPIVLRGEAPALSVKENMLMHDLDTLHIECLPDRIPENIEADVSSLKEANETIRVQDLKLPSGVSVLNDPEQVVVKITARPEVKVAEEKPTAPPAAEVPAAEKKPEEEEKKEA